MISQASQTGQFSREFPSEEYMAQLNMYRDVHVDGLPDKNIPGKALFTGDSLSKHVPTIHQVIKENNISTLLDYGCGKAVLHDNNNEIKTPDGRVLNNIDDYWGVNAQCYDPGYLPHSVRPSGTFELVVCVEVLECCSCDDIPWIIDDLFRYASKAVFIAIECYPAVIKMPNRYDAHITIRPGRWWGPIVEEVARDYPNINYYGIFDNRDPIPGKPGKATERRQFLSGPPYELITL